jgi:ABC-type lipopolysaccharide export system ATPase subunit
MPVKGHLRRFWHIRRLSGLGVIPGNAGVAVDGVASGVIQAQTGAAIQSSNVRDLIRRALGRQHGRTVKEGRASDLAGDEYIRQVYLGV